MLYDYNNECLYKTYNFNDTLYNNNLEVKIYIINCYTLHLMKDVVYYHLSFNPDKYKAILVKVDTYSNGLNIKITINYFHGCE